MFSRRIVDSKTFRLRFRVTQVFGAALALPFFTFSPLAWAQSASPDASTSASASNPSEKPAPNSPSATASTSNTGSTDTQTLNKIVVTGVPFGEEVTPTRPIDSLYGFISDPLDTPRGIAEISKSQLDFEPIKTIQDFQKFSAGVSPTFGQGSAVAPLIRGSTGEAYIDGVLPFEGEVHPINFNAYESAELVRGPASVIIGPTANTSGYINYEYKAPVFDRNQTEITANFGSWVSGGQGSYPSFSQQIDNSGPLIKNKLAYRISFEKQESEFYYQPSNNDFNSVYAALTWIPYKNITVETNFDYSNYDFIQSRGFNRVTQSLIDNGTYDGGTASPVFKSAASGANYYEVNPDGTYNLYNFTNHQLQIVSANNAGAASLSSASSPATLAGWVLNPSNVNQEKIYGYETAADSTDHYKIKNIHAETKATFRVDDDYQIVNKTLYTHFNYALGQFDNAFSAYTVADAIENRTESIWNTNFNIGKLNITDQSNTGVSLRFQHDVGYGTTTAYTQNPYDLLAGSPYSFAALLGLNGQAGTGSGGVNYSSIYNQYIKWAQQVGGPENTTAALTGPFRPSDGTEREFALYTQHNFKIGDQWGLNLGGRLTVWNAELNQWIYAPSTPPGNLGDTTLDIFPAFEGSLTYKPIPQVTNYFTYDYTVSPTAQVFTGNIPYAGTSNNQLGGVSLHRQSVLYELGSKFELQPNTWYADVDVYSQTRVQSNSGGVVSQVWARGVELNTTYQPDKHWTIGGNFTWMNANYVNQSLGSYYSPNGFAADGTTVFADSNVINKLVGGDFRLGLPEQTFNVYGIYRFDFGLGAEVSLNVMSDYTVNYIGTVRVPAQYQLDTALFYQQPHYEVRIDLNNITDERNFVPNVNDANASDAIQPNVPFNVQATVKVIF